MLNELWFLYDSFFLGHYRFIFVVKLSLPSTQTENCISIPYSLFLIPYSFLSRAIFIFLQRDSQNHCICHIQVICWISVKTCSTSSCIIFQHLAPRFNGEIITKSGSKFCRGFSIFYFSIYVALRNDNDRHLQL